VVTNEKDWKSFQGGFKTGRSVLLEGFLPEQNFPAEGHAGNQFSRTKIRSFERIQKTQEKRLTINKIH
jgi:hypothetical protein